jgi:NADH-quinone oxidoreductase subunit A
VRPAPQPLAQHDARPRRGRVGRGDGVTEPLSPYLTFALWFGGIMGFVGLTLLMNAALGPKPRPTAVKLEPFECGATPVDTLNVKSLPIKYYAVAIVFILFDLETVFLFLWAIGAQPLTGWLLVTFGFFVLLLVLMLLYVWKSRIIEEVTQ